VVKECSLAEMMRRSIADISELMFEWSAIDSIMIGDLVRLVSRFTPISIYYRQKRELSSRVELIHTNKWRYE